MKNIESKIKASYLLLTSIILITVGPFYLSAQNYSNTIYNISARSTDNLLVVDKSQQKLYVIKSSEPAKIEWVSEFRITSGQVKGDKEKEGDLKTPEGIYTLVNKLPGEKLPEMYGPMALVMDYPNYVDRLFGHTGGNIWIHGRNEEIQDRQTRGCISLENSHILDLSPYVKVGDTKVIVHNNLEFMNKEKYTEKMLEWERYLREWEDFWEQGEMQSYFDYYSSRFKSLEEFKSRKENIEKIYQWKDIALDSILIIASNQEAYINFFQIYQCPQFISKGQKKLKIIPENLSWKIVKEDFQRISKKKYFKPMIRDYVEKWRKSWVSQNVEMYISYYDSAFTSRGMSRMEWQEDKKAKFEQAEKIEVGISSMQISSPAKMTWEVKFEQKYSSDVYHDVGNKTLLITRNDDGFLIINEKWSR